MKQLGITIFTMFTQLLASFAISLMALLLVDEVIALPLVARSFSYIVFIALIGFGFNLLLMYVQAKRWRISLYGLYGVAITLTPIIITHEWKSALILSVILTILFVLYHIFISKLVALQEGYPKLQVVNRIANIVALIINTTLMVMFILYLLHNTYKSYHEETVVYKHQGLYGLELELTHQQLTPAIYTEIGRFYENRAAVRIGDKLGFIDRTGKQVIPCQFYNCLEPRFNFIRFRFGLLPVCNEHGKVGIINHQGQWVYPAACDSAKRMHNERYIKLYQDGCVGLFSAINDSLLIPIEYEYIFKENIHFFALKNNQYTKYLAE